MDIYRYRIFMTTSKKKARKKNYVSPKGSGGLFGAKKTSSAPVTANDSGKSNSYLSVLAGVCEGQMQGLINGGQSIYLDNTPVLNSDGSANFTGFSFDVRNGLQNQGYMPGYADSVNQEVPINTEVKWLQPIVRQIINKNLDSITVRLALTLQTQDANGNVNGTDIRYRIWIKEGLNVYRLIHDIIITNKKYSSPTEFEYIVPVINNGGTVDNFLLKVERLSPTVPVGENTIRTINFAAFINSSITKLSYPNTALVGLTFEASQFNSAPQVAFEIRGIIVDIPSNAVVIATGALVYTGVWNGLLYTPPFACSDPAWILWDLLTKKRYGLGKKLNITNLNRWKFLEISKYCNEIVPDALGNDEHRFLANFVLESAEDAYKVIETIRSIFHGMSYFLGGSMHFGGDFPGVYVAQFTQADVENGMFSYSRTGLKAVHNVAIVTWIDPSQSYTKQIETVEDYASIITDGYKPTELVAFGATSRGQARRAGLYVLYSEKLNRETVTFKCRSFASNVFPTQLIKVSDNKRADIRYGGLIQNYGPIIANNRIVNLDYPVILVSGEVYTLSIVCEDGLLYDFPVSNDGATTNSLSITWLNSNAPLPAVEGNWILSSINIKPQLFRVLNRIAVSGTNETMFEITALQHDPQKYATIDFGSPLEPIPPRPVITSVTNIITNLVLTFNVIGMYPNISFTLIASWSKPKAGTSIDPFIVSYLVEHKIGFDGIWSNTLSTSTNQIEYSGLRFGYTYIRVASIDIYGKSSKWVESTGKFLGIQSSIAKFNTGLNADSAMIVL